MAEYFNASNVNTGDMEDIEVENEKCLSENRALRTKLQLVKQNSSLRVANILAEVLTWIDQSTRETSGLSENANIIQQRQSELHNKWSGFKIGSKPVEYDECKCKEKSGNTSFQSNFEQKSEQSSPRKSLFQRQSSENNSFQPLTAEIGTPQAQNKTQDYNASYSGCSSPFSDHHKSPTPESKSPTTVNVKEHEQVMYSVITPAVRQQRGSIIYDTRDIKLNVQQSEGFKPIQEIPDTPRQDNERSRTPTSTNRNHGYVWMPNGPSSSPSPFATSTPLVSSKIIENSKETRQQWSPSPVKLEKESLKQTRKSSQTQGKIPRKTDKTVSRERSPRASAVNTDKQESTSPKNANFSSNASSISFAERGRSITPSSRKNRSPYWSTNEMNTSEGETSGFHSHDPENVSINGMKVKPTTKLLGEVAFQLDRKILNYVFHTSKKKRRFYGYIIRNIPEKIRREATIDEKTGLVDAQKKHTLQYRYQYILNTLKPLGYRLDFHPDFCADMVNKYGLLPLPPERNTSDGIMPEQKDLVMETIKRIAPGEEIQDMSIILNCLTLLAKDDDSAIISF